MRRFVSPIPCVLVLILLGCTAGNTQSAKTLDRKNAAKMISSSAKFSCADEYKNEPSFFSGDACFYWFTVGDYRGPQNLPKPLDWLKSQGYIEPVWLSADRFGNLGSAEFHKPAIGGLKLTEKGRTASKDWKLVRKFGPTNNVSEVWAIPLADRKIVEVTGIASEPVANAKKAEFRWTYEFTSVGKQLVDSGSFEGLDPKTVYRSKATFVLYDDGWRLENLNIKGMSY